MVWVVAPCQVMLLTLSAGSLLACGFLVSCSAYLCTCDQGYNNCGDYAAGHMWPITEAAAWQQQQQQQQQGLHRKGPATSACLPGSIRLQSECCRQEAESQVLCSVDADSCLGTVPLMSCAVSRRKQSTRHVNLTVMPTPQIHAAKLSLELT